MSKKFVITEEERKSILSNYVSEQVVQGKGSDPYEYKKEGGYYYTRKKGSNNWIFARGNAALSIATNIFKDKPKVKQTPVTTQTKTSTSKTYCPAFPPSADVSKELIPNYQIEGGKMISIGIPQRTACEIAYIKIRPKYSGKSFFVVDTLQNLIYLFDKKGNFVAKSPMLDGADAQSQDLNKIARALWTWQQQVESLGFKWDSKQQKYLDKTPNKRRYSHDMVYNAIDKNDTRFFPKGIYSINAIQTDDEYAGGDNNLFTVQTLDGKRIAQAIHGFYNEAPRVEALNQLKQKMGHSASVKSTSVPPEFIKMVQDYNQTQKFNKSYGCINVPVDFLNAARPYAKGSMLFVIGETKNNYLVQNSETFFQKMGNGESCSNPESLGQEIPNIEAIA